MQQKPLRNFNRTIRMSQAFFAQPTQDFSESFSFSENADNNVTHRTFQFLKKIPCLKNPPKPKRFGGKAHRDTHIRCPLTFKTLCAPETNDALWLVPPSSDSSWWRDFSLLPRRCASEGSRQRNERSSISSSVMDSSNLSEHSVATDVLSAGRPNKRSSQRTL